VSSRLLATQRGLVLLSCAATSITRSADSTGSHTLFETVLQVSVHRMMFSTDHPYQALTEATAFLAGLPLAPHGRERIAHGNAERVTGHLNVSPLTLPRSTPTAPHVGPGAG
jgi:predicted TIM-barrel fold metal-dependent hydrolase